VVHRAGTGVQGTSNFNPSVSGPGTFTLTYDVSNAAGVTCGTINDPNIPITITVNDPVPATMTPSLTEGCEDLVIGVYNNTPNSTNCIWKINGADFFGSCDSIHTTLTDPGCYDFTLITTDPNNCVDTLDMQDLICVFPTPEVSFISSPSSVTMDDPQFTFHNTSPALVGLDWDFAGYGSSTSNDPVFSFDDVTSAGTYTVCLLGTDVNGCQNSYCNDVLIKDAFQVYTPSAITPDNDNLNEAFRPVITGEDQVKDYYMRIFDRWGNIVFETHDMKEYWNANNNGDQYYVNNGVYHWLLEITLYGLDATQYFEGSLSVVR
jgi:gliding motility-associated-like protein